MLDVYVGLLIRGNYLVSLNYRGSRGRGSVPVKHVQALE